MLRDSKAVGRLIMATNQVSFRVDDGCYQITKNSVTGKCHSLLIP